MERLWSQRWPCHRLCEFEQDLSPTRAQFLHLYQPLLLPEAHRGFDNTFWIQSLSCGASRGSKSQQMNCRFWPAPCRGLVNICCPWHSDCTVPEFSMSYDVPIFKVTYDSICDFFSQSSLVRCNCQFFFSLIANRRG